MIASAKRLKNSLQISSTLAGVPTEPSFLAPLVRAMTMHLGRADYRNQRSKPRLEIRGRRLHFTQSSLIRAPLLHDTVDLFPD